MTRRSIILSAIFVLLIAVAILIRIQSTSVNVTGSAFTSWNLRESVLLANPLQGANGDPLQSARLVRAAIIRSDFETAETLTQNVLKTGHLPTPNARSITHFLDALIDPADTQFETQLSGWVRESPASMVAHLLRAKFYYDAGWYRRGHGYINTVSEQGVKEFSDVMGKGEQDVDRALQIDASEPYLQLLRLDILLGTGYSDKMGRALQESISKFPTFFAPYDVVLSALQPKWGGNIEIMFSFVDHFRSTAPDGIATKLLDLDVYRYLLSTASLQCQDDSENSDYQHLSECVREFMKTNMTAEREGRVVEALSALGQRDDYIATKTVEDILSAMIDTAGSEIYVGPTLQAAANGYKSDTRLREDSDSHNHYIIDCLVARTWLRRGNLDNALSKYQEALRHLPLAKFPSTHEQDAASAEIKGQIAKVYSRQGRYPESIDVAREAVALGGNSESQLYVCYGYFQQKNYQAAVKECAELASDQENGMSARYWRGSAFRALHDDDNAIKEFSAVAASKNTWRASAAIGLSMIYFGRNDNPSALNVLNKYDYLYDLKLTDRADVAVAFNNRCYAYMELGDLKKALDDCTSSLANGNIPDAYEKQQELLNRMASR